MTLQEIQRRLGVNTFTAILVQAVLEGRPSRADGRVDCPSCGSHGSRCQEDRDDGTTVCHSSGAVLE